MFRTAIKSFVGTASVVAATLAVLSSPAWAGKPVPVTVGPTPISACQNITEPGSYVLVNDLPATGNCLFVTASSVMIDLGGFTITGPGNGVGIFAENGDGCSDGNLKAVSVFNGTITNFQVGIHLLCVDNAVVHNVQAVYNHGGAGILVGVGSRVTDNTASYNGDDAYDDATRGIEVDCPSLVTGNVAINNKHGAGSADLHVEIVDGACTTAHNLAPSNNL